MRVKKIELIGFKSFADRTEIHLNPGVTCIVGPNGCGKSNISDAIRWVFGERSAKLLRGSRMEDVIFAGTEFRKPLGMAEVSLTIDNQDHVLPIEYEEVVLTRRLDRSGQSQYFLNRTPCRLKDILDLILDTGMGSNSYSMIEQGRVDSVINADPQERRFLIEEAAGISKYKLKKEEALRKLERTEQNLLRIRDIVSEVQKNIQYAERQAKRAERYKSQFEELKRLEIKKARWDLGELGKQKAAEDSKKQELLQTQVRLEEELRKAFEEETQQKKLLEEILQKESSEASRFFELRSESNSLAQKKEFNRERLEGSRHRQIEIRKEQELLTLQRAHLEKELQRQTLQFRQSDEEQKTSTQSYDEERERFEEEEKRLNGVREKIENLKALIFDNAGELARVKNESHRLQTLFERLGHEDARRNEAIGKFHRERSMLEEKRLTFQREKAQRGEEIRAGEPESERVSRLLVESRASVETLEKQTREKQLKLREINSRIQLLEELQESAEESQKKILHSFSKTPLQGKLVKSLREVLRIQAGYEAAVEAVLGAFAQALVAADIETAQGLMQEMAESHGGPCAIFIQSLSKPGTRADRRRSVSHPSIQQSLEKVVSVQPGYELLFAPLFENVYLVDNFSPEKLGEFLTLAGEVKLVTRQGILLGPDSRIFFRNGRLSSDQGPFRRSAEISALKESREVLNREIEKFDSQKEEATEKVQLLEKEHRAFEERDRDRLVKKEAGETYLQGLGERLVTTDQELHLLGVEQKDSRQESSRVKSELKEFDHRILELEAVGKNLTKQQKETEQRLLDTQRIRESQLQKLSRLKTLLEGHEARRGTVEMGCQLIEKQMIDLEDRMKNLDDEGREMESRIEAIQEEDIFIQKKQEVVSEELRSSEASLSDIRGRKSFQDEKFRELQSRVHEIEERVRVTREDSHQEEIKWMELSYQEKTIFERMGQAYHVKPDELHLGITNEETLDQTTLEEEIQLLKTKVEAFGPVNLLAVEEYEELKQRHDYLTAQEKDLVEARESLLEAIRQINRTTKTLFGDTFAKAQALFQEYYQTLFGGGHAELILVPNEGERGEEGVDILVRPPGKKLQHISLLSGGEKALTAVALLFALFRIRPSPLCVLDEVDAPLDEANVDRFLTVLRTFLESTQFLIVTHNRKTIAMGDFLYGVTMEESGISKLVSVKVAQLALATAA